MAVANDGSGTPNAFGSAITSLSLTTFTVGSGANSVLVGLAGFDVNVTGRAMTWNATETMTEAHTYLDNGQFMTLWVLINPTAGNQTLAAAWTGSSRCHLAAVEFSGADQTTGFKAVDNATAGPTANNVAITITSSTDGATVASAISGFGNITVTDQTSIFANNPGGANGAASYALGGASNTHTFTTAAVNNDAAGIHILVAAGGAVALKGHGMLMAGYRQSLLQRV